MIKNWFKQIQQQKIFAKTALLLVFFALSSSCTDQGCIDADDFGEYESETVTVVANMNSSSCTYDYAATDGVTDSTQGEGLKICLTTGTNTITDETDATQTSDAGCTGFTDEKFQNLCISQCVTTCMSNAGSASASPEPNWISTSARSTTMNAGVTISPGAQIIITAVGQVVLGTSLEYPDVYVPADSAIPSYKDDSWKDIFFDVTAGKSLSMKFSGKWYDGANYVGGGSGTIGDGGSADIQFHNGARRLVAYVVPHPEGYSFDTSQASEYLGTTGVPLMPDAVAWTCDYSGSSVYESTCYQKTGGYTSNGYPNADDELTAATFPFTSASQSSILSSYGGAIRWTGDGTNSSSDATNSTTATMSVASCSISGSTVTCSNLPSDSTVGRVVGNVSGSSIDINNPSTDGSAYQVTFKSLYSAATTCNITYSMIDPNGQTISVPVTNSAWSGSSTGVIVLEYGQKITVNASSSSGVCGQALGVKFDKYKDIPITQSGFVKFTTLGGASGNCTLRGRVINPNKLVAGEVVSNVGGSNYYEYSDFNSASISDTLTGLSVKPSSTTLVWTPGKTFVRKGQVMRFSADSWNGSWTTSAGVTRQCGIGMIMMITPRPALICRGKANDYVSNPNCSVQYNTSGVLIGCTPTAPSCLDSSDASNYCPSASCQKLVTCPVDGVAPTYDRTGTCTLAAAITDASLCPTLSTDTKNTTSTSDDVYTYTEAVAANSKAGTSAVNAVTSTTCNNCSNLLKTSAEQAAKNQISNLDQCYDLENYLGRVSDILTAPVVGSTNEAEGVIYSDSEITNLTTTTGLVKLGNFNGSYGNFENYSDSGTVDSSHLSNKILQLNSSIIFSQAGRLKFFMLDGSDFSDISTPDKNIVSAFIGNSPSSTGYSGSNGMTVNASGMLDFSNGQWMQARLCLESSDDSVDCKGSDPADPNVADSTLITDPNQPRVIDITAPTSTTPAGTPPVITSNYMFDGYGYLSRTSNAVIGLDCTDAVNGIESAALVNFYCHTYQYYSDDDLAKKTDDDKSDITTQISRVRLTFKILDPETPDCAMLDDEGASLDGVKTSNPYYGSTVDEDGVVTYIGTGEVCNNSETGENCLKEFYCANIYANNSGQYDVNVKVKVPVSSSVSSIIGNVITPIIEVMDGPKSRDCKVTGASTSDDGVITDNPYYDSTNSVNTGATCDVYSTSCGAQYYCKESLGQAERIYKLLISDSRFKSITTMCFVMMFTFYGVGYLMGTSELNHSEILNRIIKIGLIYLFIGEDGWNWFNLFFVKFFKNSTDYLAFLMASSFDDSPTIATAIATGDYYDKSVLFSSVDDVFSMFFSQAVQKKISALLFASIFGWAYLLIIYNSFILYIYAVANAVLLYLTAQVFISILFTLGPIFFIFTIFTQTKDMFDNWLKQLIGFSLQQIFLLTTLAFFNMLMYEVIKMSLGYKICWDDVWTINILITRVTLLSFWNIASLPPRANAQTNVGDIGNPEGIPSLFSILFIWVIASLMNKFITFMTDLASSIGGGLSASSLGAGIASAAGSVSAMAKAGADKVWDASGGQVVQRLDQSLFDSGKKADEARTKEKSQNIKDKSNKSAMMNAGEAAADKYLSNAHNKIAYDAMDGEAQKALMSKIRHTAMDEKGAELGLSKKEVSRLKDDKGRKITSENAFGAAFQLGSQAVSQARGTGGTLTKSLNDQVANADDRMSSTEAKNLLRSETDPEKRKKLLEGFEKNNSVKAETRLEKMNSFLAEESEKAYKNLSKGAKDVGSGALDLASDAATLANPFGEKGKRARAEVGEKIGAALKDASKDSDNFVKSGLKSLKDLPTTLSNAASSAKDSALAVKDDTSAAVSAATSNVKSAVLNPKETAVSAGKAMSSAASAVGGLASSGYVAAKNAVTNAVTDKEGDKATKQLEKDGIVNKMAFGTGWSRDASEQGKIDALKAENIKNNKTDTGVANISALSALRKEANKLDVKDGVAGAVKKEDSQIRSEATASALATTQQRTQASIKLEESKLQGSVDKNGVKTPGLLDARAETEKQLNAANTAYEQHVKQSAANPDNVRRAELNAIVEADNKRILPIVGRVLDNALTAGAAGFIGQKTGLIDNKAAKAREELSKMPVDQKLVALDNDRKKASVAFRNVDSQVKSSESKINDLKKFGKSVDEASNVVRAEAPKVGGGGSSTATAPTSTPPLSSGSPTAADPTAKGSSSPVVNTPVAPPPTLGGPTIPPAGSTPAAAGSSSSTSAPPLSGATPAAGSLPNAATKSSASAGAVSASLSSGPATANAMTPKPTTSTVTQPQVTAGVSAPTTAAAKVAGFQKAVESKKNVAQANRATANAKKAEAKKGTNLLNRKKDDKKDSGLLGKLFGKKNDELKAAHKEAKNGRREERAADKEAKDLAKIEKSDMVTRADNIVNRAQSILGGGGSADSKEYKDASRTMNEFNNVNSPDSFQEFVSKEEKRSKTVQKDAEKLRGAKDVEKFSKKHGGDNN